MCLISSAAPRPVAVQSMKATSWLLSAAQLCACAHSGHDFCGEDAPASGNCQKIKQTAATCGSTGQQLPTHNLAEWHPVPALLAGTLPCCAKQPCFAYALPLHWSCCSSPCVPPKGCACCFARPPSKTSQASGRQKLRAHTHTHTHTHMHTHTHTQTHTHTHTHTHITQTDLCSFTQSRQLAHRRMFWHKIWVRMLLGAQIATSADRRPENKKTTCKPTATSCPALPTLHTRTHTHTHTQQQ